MTRKEANQIATENAVFESAESSGVNLAANIEDAIMEGYQKGLGDAVLIADKCASKWGHLADNPCDPELDWLFRQLGAREVVDAIRKQMEEGGKS